MATHDNGLLAQLEKELRSVARSISAGRLQPGDRWRPGQYPALDSLIEDGPTSTKGELALPFFELLDLVINNTAHEDILNTPRTITYGWAIGHLFSPRMTRYDSQGTGQKAYDARLDEICEGAGIDLGSPTKAQRRALSSGLRSRLAAEIIQLCAPGLLESPVQAGSSESRRDGSVSITLTLGYEPNSARKSYAVSVAGDVEGWQLQMLKARSTGKNEPTTDVIIKTEEGVRYFFGDTEDTPHQQLVSFETMCAQFFGRTSEEAIRDLAKYPVQYHYYLYSQLTAQRLAELVQSALSHTWLVSRPSLALFAVNSERSLSHQDPVTISVRVGIALSEMQAIAGSDLGERDWYAWKYLIYERFPTLGTLGEDYLRRVGVPALAREWLQLVPDALDPASYFDTNRWRLEID